MRIGEYTYVHTNIDSKIPKLWTHRKRKWIQASSLEDEMKKVLTTLVLIVVVVVLFSMRVAQGYSDVKYSVTTINDITFKTISATIVSEKKSAIDEAIEEMQEKMSEIDSNSENNREWFVSYKEITSEYGYILDPPETVYDYFTEDEILLIQRVVETECYDQDFDSKCNVASVVFNRYYSDDFGETIKEVVTKPNQFAYGRKKTLQKTPYWP